MFVTIQRVVKTSMQHMMRNAKLSAASILIMALTFFVTAVFLLALYGASIILTYFEGQSQIIVFFNPDTVTQQYIQTVKQAVVNDNVPVSITYVSKQEAYKKFITFLKEDSPSLTQSVNANKLPPSIEFRTTNISDLQTIANTLYTFQSQGNMIDKILYYKDVEDFLKQFISIMQFTGIAFVVFLMGISLLIIWITIGIALSSHEDEIEIMQLVGATRWYIQLPYILEGAMYGIIGSIVSLILLLIVFLLVTKVYSTTFVVFLSYFKGIPLPALSFLQILLMILLEICIGAIVGSIGSFIAVRNRLR